MPRSPVRVFQELLGDIVGVEERVRFGGGWDGMGRAGFGPQDGQADKILLDPRLVICPLARAQTFQDRAWERGFRLARVKF